MLAKDCPSGPEGPDGPVGPVGPVVPTDSQKVPFHFQVRRPTVNRSFSSGELGKSMAGIIKSLPYLLGYR
jgi:hypothetical protein